MKCVRCGEPTDYTEKCEFCYGLIEELSDELVSVHDGNTDWNELYYEIRVLGFLVDDCGGNGEYVKKWAKKRSKEIRENVNKKLERLITQGYIKAKNL